MFDRTIRAPRRERRIAGDARSAGRVHALVWWFRVRLWTSSDADFGTMNQTRKQRFASVLIDSEVRRAADSGTANFRTRIRAYARRKRYVAAYPTGPVAGLCAGGYAGPGLCAGRMARHRFGARRDAG